MPTKTIYAFLLIFYFSCSGNSSSGTEKVTSIPGKITKGNDVNPYKTIDAIPLPEGFHRNIVASNSFGNWLRNVFLKKSRVVYKYDGTLKGNQSAQYAVLDISVGKQNLQQCADAVMRLRAEFFFSQHEYDSILFVDNNGGRYQFNTPYSRVHFDQYLNTVFGMCGSASLSKQLHTIRFADLSIGDVIIRGGFPGHAVIVMDVAQNDAGKKMFLIAQSYMPAQDIHVLRNPLSSDLSPWYEVNDQQQILTPEYSFYSSEVKRW